MAGKEGGEWIIDGRRDTTLGPVYSLPLAYVFPPLARSRRCPHHRGTEVSLTGGGTTWTASGNLLQSPSAFLIYTEWLHRVFLITDRPLFINGELVFTFTHARLPAITHHRHARAGVSRARDTRPRRGALPAAPRIASWAHRQGHRGSESKDRHRVDSRGKSIHFVEEESSLRGETPAEGSTGLSSTELSSPRPEEHVTPKKNALGVWSYKKLLLRESSKRGLPG